MTRYYYVYGQRNLHSVVYAGAPYTAFAAFIGLLARGSVLAGVGLGGKCAAAAQTVLATHRACANAATGSLAYTAIQFGSSLFTTAHGVAAENERGLFGGAALLALHCWQCAGVAGGLSALSAQPGSGWVSTGAAGTAGFALYLSRSACLSVIHHAGNYVKGQFDRLVIYQGYSAATLGVYSAGYQTASVLGVLLMAPNKATVPYYYQALRSGKITAATVRRWALLALIAPLPAVRWPG